MRPKCSRCRGYVDLKYEMVNNVGIISVAVCLICGARWYRPSYEHVTVRPSEEPTIVIKGY